MIYRHKNIWFETVVEPLKNRDLFPSIKPSLRRLPVTHGFFEKKARDIKKRYQSSLSDVSAAMKSFTTITDAVIPRFDQFMLDYDREVLKSTCALSIWKGAHTDLDMTGGPGAYNDFEIPESVKSVVVSYYNRTPTPPDEELSMTMIKGKTPGYPYNVPGSDRVLSTLGYAASAAAVSWAHANNISLRDLKLEFERFHGPASSMYAERTQNVAKPQLMILREGMYQSQNFEPRKRGILMVPKFMVMYNRKSVQQIKKKILMSGVHSQDRARITNDLLERKGYTTKAKDWPKFDYTFGGKAGASVLTMFPLLSTGKLDDFMEEFRLPLIYFGSKGIYRDDSSPQLPSGASFTSLMGCIANFSVTLWAICNITSRTPEAVLKDMDNGYWKLNAWGDDTVLSFKDGYATHEKFDAAIKAIIKKDMDVEPVLRYLGDVYPSTWGLTAHTGYQPSRFVQQQFFPERSKLWPFNIVGYIARLDKVSPKLSQSIHDEMLKIWPESFGKPFTYAERHGIAEALLPELEKQAFKISQLDDVIMAMTHGSDEFDDTPMGSYFDKLMGYVQVDITKPEDILEKESSAFDNPMALKSFKDSIAALQKDGMGSYQLFLNSMRIYANVRYLKGGPIY